MYAALAKQPPVYIPTTAGHVDGVAGNTPTVQNGKSAKTKTPNHSNMVQSSTSVSDKNSSRPKTIPLSSAYMQLKEEEEKLSSITSGPTQNSSEKLLEGSSSAWASKLEVNNNKNEANDEGSDSNMSWMKKKKIPLEKHEDLEENNKSSVAGGIDRPRRESKKPKVFDETEFEDYYSSKSKKSKKVPSVDNHRNNNDESEQRVTPVPLLMTSEDVRNEWKVLEKRAKDAAYKEWEIECAKRNLKYEVDRQHSVHAHRIVQDANSRLKYLYADVVQAMKMSPKLGGGVDQNNLMIKFSDAAESMSKYLVDFERALEKIISTESKPVLPSAPRSSEPYLPSLPTRPSTPIGEEAEFVDQLVLFAQESSKGNKNNVKGEGGESDNNKPASNNKNNSNDNPPPGSIALPDGSFATPLVRIEPVSIAPLNRSTTTFGYGHPADMACELHYDFDCQEMVKRMVIRYDAGGHPPGRTLTSYYRDLDTGVEPTLPTHINVSVIAYQPANPSSGRVACCVLCGEFINREDFRAKARARKRISSAVCMVHHYHAQCFALIEATFKGRCIAPRMGIPSMCQSSDKNLSRYGRNRETTAASNSADMPALQPSSSLSSAGETTTTTTTTTTTMARSLDDDEEEERVAVKKKHRPSSSFVFPHGTRVPKLGMYSQAAGLTPETAFRVAIYEEEFENVKDQNDDREAADETSEGDGDSVQIEIVSVHDGDHDVTHHHSSKSKKSLTDFMSRVTEPVPLLVTDKHISLADSS